MPTAAAGRHRPWARRGTARTGRAGRTRRSARRTSGWSAQAAAAAGGGRGRGGAGPAWQPNIGGCESGFTIPDPADAEHRLCALLRQQGDALGCAHGYGAVDRAVDGFARFAAERDEVPLPLDRADGDRSVRSQQRPLWLPADPEDHQRRAVVDRVQPGSLHQGSVAASSRTAGSSATTLASTTARSCGTSNTRRSSAV